MTKPGHILDSLFAQGQNTWAVFVGAGISVASGIPAANALTNKILSVLRASRVEKRQILKSRIPFELVMETLRERIDLTRLLDAFESTTPNTYHYFLAQLLACRQITTIATTNYDTLIEQAVGALGLRRDRDFLVYSREAEFNSLDWNDDRPRILKLHGCISDRDNIYMTLSRVASRAYVTTIDSVIRSLFASGPHYKLLIMGYSCSDHFDISPIIRSISDELRDILLIQHNDLPQSAWYCEPLSAMPDRNPFAAAKNGRRLYADSEAAIKLLWDRHQKLIGLRPKSLRLPSGDQWKQAVEIWGKHVHMSASSALDSHVLGRLLVRGNRYVRARVAFERSLAAAEKEGDIFLAAQARLNLGICSYRLGELRESLRWQRAALADSRRLKLPKLEGQSLGNIGNVHYTANRLQLACRYQGKCLRLARKYRLDQLEANTLGNMGIIFEKKQDYGRARQYHTRAARLAFRIGDAIGQARHWHNVAVTYRLQEKRRVAFKWFLAAEQWARVAGQYEIVAGCLLGRGRLLIRAGRETEAEACLLESLRLLNQTDERLELLKCNKVLGDLYQQLGLQGKARHFWRRAQEIARRDKQGRGIGLRRIPPISR